MNQYELVMTAGNDRTFILDFADFPFTLTDATVRFTVDDMFTKPVTVDESAGDMSVTIDAADTEDHPHHALGRCVHRYEVRVTEDDGDVVTVRRGRFVIVAALDTVE